MTLRLTLVALGLSCAGLTASAQQTPLFFDVNADARTAGLGGQMNAGLEADLHAAAFNPAFLDCSDVGGWTVDYVNYFGSTTLGTVNTVWTAEGNRTYAVGARFVTYGSMTEYDASGVATGGAFSAGDVVLQTSTSWVVDAGVGHRMILGVTGWAGTRAWDRDVALLTGLDAAARGVWTERKLSWGVAWTGRGSQWGLGSRLPSGKLVGTVQLGLAKSFANAPFSLYLQAVELQTWDLAPAGTYDPVIDPLTGESSSLMAFPFGDALMRHIIIGTELDLGDALAVQLGYDYRRRQEMKSNGMPGTNGLSLGVLFGVKRLKFRISRNTYHFAGASTHLGLRFDLNS